eukprot:CAMPEP_0119337468 /NCGR_PEP_ID=MMETSP1333-20130426/94053_1 /TAXON_ID=418940 /ORGANISM="Scyphosphaera apsteinii, Strain RCC1455" /LENGTH=103 /DNA_ID=CAMNT_0007348517 /DNA_START=205 /DNA_END=516 /DNA_ORIENTATION=-
MSQLRRPTPPDLVPSTNAAVSAAAAATVASRSPRRNPPSIFKSRSFSSSGIHASPLLCLAMSAALRPSCVRSSGCAPKEVRRSTTGKLHTPAARISAVPPRMS